MVENYHSYFQISEKNKDDRVTNSRTSLFFLQLCLHCVNGHIHKSTNQLNNLCKIMMVKKK